MNPKSLEKLPFNTILGYGAGDFGFNLAFSLSATFLLYYYTDVAGISAAAVGTMFFVVRLWDGLADLIAGRAVDRTMTRWGKFRPYLMFGAVPLLLLSYLVFHVPAGLEDGTKLLYAYISYAALGFVYSLANIPYGSLASAVTQSVHERAKLVAGRAFGAAVGSIILTFVIGGMVNDLRAQKAAVVTPADLAAYQAAIQDVFTKVTLAFIVIGTAAFWFTAWACRERVVRRQPRITVRETIATLKSNKPLAYLCGSSFFYMTGVFAVTGSTAFYAQYVLNDISLVGVITLVNTGISLLITPVIPWIIRKVGKKRVYQYCGVFTVVGGVGLFPAPADMLWLVLLTLAYRFDGQSQLLLELVDRFVVKVGDPGMHPKNGLRDIQLVFAWHEFIVDESACERHLSTMTGHDLHVGLAMSVLRFPAGRLIEVQLPTQCLGLFEQLLKGRLRQ